MITDYAGEPIRYQKAKTKINFIKARDSGSVVVASARPHANHHANMLPLSLLNARCRSCYPTNSIKALKAVCSSFDFEGLV